MFTFIHLLHSLKKYLHTYLVPGIFLDTGDSAVKPTEKNPCPPGANILVGQINNKQNK